MNQQLHILLVEDDPNDAELFQLALHQSAVKASLYTARDGEQAVDYISGNGLAADHGRYPIPDLIVLDLALPRLTGLAFIRWCRTSASCKQTPLVVFTGKPKDDKETEAALRLGADLICLKPASFSLLLDAIKKIYAFGIVAAAARQPPGARAA